MKKLLVCLCAAMICTGVAYGIGADINVLGIKAGASAWDEKKPDERAAKVAIPGAKVSAG